MTWQDDLRRVRITIDGKVRDLVGASFRGVPFLVETVELATGRRLVVHEFPLRDNPFVEDLGRRGRKFKVDGYLIGDEYLTQKTALLNALEAEGPGSLVLPYYATTVAIGETSSVRETRAEGGFAVVTIEFVEAPAQTPTPTIEVDTAAQVGTSADAAAAANETQFAADYDATGLPSFALASAESAIRTAATTLSAVLAPAVQDMQELARLNAQLTLVAAQASALARQPATLLTQARTAIMNLATTAANSPGALMNALIAAYGAALAPPVIGTTATRQREAANQAALTGAVRRVMAIEAARLAPVVPYASLEDAIAARDQIAALLDDQAQTAGDTVYPALSDLRSQVLRAVPGTTAFARVITITQRTSIPLTVLVYRLYGPLPPASFEAMYADIIARNKIRHPGFVVGTLKVLSNAI